MAQTRVHPNMLQEPRTIDLGLAATSSYGYTLTNSVGDRDQPAGRIAASVVSNVDGSEDVTIDVFPQVAGNDEELAAISLGNGVVGRDGTASPVFLAFQGFGTYNTRSYFVNNVQVIGGRATGWGAPTGTATRAAFNTTTVTLPQLAERVKALIDDLASHGIIGV